MEIETYYYRVHIVWGPYPFHDEIDEKYVKFYKKDKKKFTMAPHLEVKANTSIAEKEEYLRKMLDIKNVKVIKIK